MCKFILDLFSRKHGFAKVMLPVNYPSIVEPGKPFSIQYKIKNTGQVTDTLWAKLVVDDKELPNSYWKRKMAPGETNMKTYNHPGITKDSIIILLTGY